MLSHKAAKAQRVSLQDSLKQGGSSLKPKVLVTRSIPREGLDLLASLCDLDVNQEDRALSKDELKSRLADKDALLSLLSDPIDRDVLAAGPRLRVVANYAVGFNNIDVAAATARGIVVTNTPGVLTETTADLAWTLLMAAARRVVEGDALVRAGKFTGWGPMLLLGHDIYGKTLGIIGLGRIGEAVARRARGFDMNVLYYSAHRKNPEDESRLGVRYASLDELLAQSDFVSIHAPLTDATRHMIGHRELAMMKPSAVLVNTARGPVVDESALVQALREGRIAAAGLDVYENEPALAPGLAELPNVTVLPHVGSASLETRTRMAEMVARDILAVLEGRTPAHPVNPEVLGQ